MKASSDTDDLLQALASPDHLLPARWLYDDAGSAAFEAITELPEYYPTRVELALLRDHAPECARLTQARSLTELGCGVSSKTHALIDGFARHGTLESFTAMDVHMDSARRTALALATDHPGIAFEALAGDFTDALPTAGSAQPHVMCFLGSTIGNFTADERRLFLSSVQQALRPGDYFLLGVDLVKEPARLLAAYDDRAGITRMFILNALSHVNHLTGAGFRPEDFDYEPTWSPEHERIEMRVRARADQRFTIAGADVALTAGETLLVEISTKFHLEAVERELEQAGLQVCSIWTGADDQQTQPDFALVLAQRAP